MIEVKCPHCSATNIYALTVTNRYEEIVCAGCRRPFFVSHEGTLAQDKESISKVMAKEKDNRHPVFIAIIALFPALIATGLITIPLLLFFEHLELSGQLKLPDSVVTPAIIAITGLFFFLWKVSGAQIGRIWFSSNQLKDEKQHVQQANEAGPTCNCRDGDG